MAPRLPEPRPLERGPNPGAWLVLVPNLPVPKFVAPWLLVPRLLAQAPGAGSWRLGSGGLGS